MSFVPPARVFAGVLLAGVITGHLNAQPQGAPPRFESADIRPSVKTINRSTQSLVGGLMGGGIYYLRRASMLDLIRLAWNMPAESVVGGPTWLEMEKYDLVAKVPSDTKPAAVRPMLQALLAERFSLAVHEDSRPLPAFGIAVSKGHHMKTADPGVTQAGTCKAESQPSGEKTIPEVAVDCRNVTMDSFTSLLPQFPGADQFIGTTRVFNKTALDGLWSFRFRYNLRPQSSEAGVSVLTIGEALEKQVGLQMEPGTLPVRTLVVDSVNMRPSAAGPGEVSKYGSPSRSFEAAVIKPTSPDVHNQRFQVLPGGRVEIDGMTLKTLIQYFWGLRDDMVLGAPDFAENDRWSLVAKAPATGAIPDDEAGINAGLPADFDTLLDMLKVLFVERFGLKYHFEDKPIAAYRLVAAKPKLRKADPTERTSCKEGTISLSKSDARDAAPVLGRLLSCTNTTMAQFAEMLQFFAPGYVHTAAIDSTGLDGGWDFSLSFSRVELVRPGSDEQGNDPNGAMSLPEAMEKQLGIRMESVRQPVPVMMIDGLTRTPTDN